MFLKKLFSSGPVPTSPRKFKKGALFPQLGLPSAVTLQENGAFGKCSPIRGV